MSNQYVDPHKFGQNLVLTHHLRGIVLYACCMGSEIEPDKERKINIRFLV